MTVQEQDVAATRAAAQQLVQCVVQLGRHYGDSVDMQRLRTDTERIAVDIDLLAGPVPTAAARQLEVIPDGDYPAEFWSDAEDEGVGRQR